MLRNGRQELASKLQRQFEQSASKVEDKLARGQTFIQQIIREQEKAAEVAEKRNLAINRDLRALRFRLRPYTRKSPRKFDAIYYRLKDEYQDLLQRRAVNSRTITIAEETIEYARMNTMPGQTYQSGEQL